MDFQRVVSSFLKVHRAVEVTECLRTSAQWSEITQAYLGLKPLKFPYEFVTRRGLRLTLNSFHDLVTIWVIFCRHEYRVPANTEVVVDAGANIGTFSIYACSHLAKKVYAVEPFPETFSQLKKNIEANKLGDRVTMKTLALADSTGFRNMDTQEAPSQSRGLLQADDQELVDCVTVNGESCKIEIPQI